MWIIGHVIALTAVIGFALLGIWQVQRHNERRQLDATLEARLVAPPASLEELEATYGAEPEGLQYRRAIVTGTFLLDEEVILQARSLNGRSGHEVLTPLELSDGTAMIVDRGWVPIDVAGPPVPSAEPPSGEVTVVGYLRTRQVRGSLGPVDPAGVELDRISRVDVDRLQEQVEPPLQPMWLQLADQQPASANEFPLIVAPPQPGDGPPHLSYAGQWAAFAVVVAVAYPILLVRTARRRTGRNPQ